MTSKKLPGEIRKVQRLGRFSAALAYSGAQAEAVWRDLTASNDPTATETIRKLVSAAREAIQNFERGRESAADMGCLLSPDPNWRPDE